jgi:hypothetical protein
LLWLFLGLSSAIGSVAIPELLLRVTFRDEEIDGYYWGR